MKWRESSAALGCVMLREWCVLNDNIDVYAALSVYHAVSKKMLRAIAALRSLCKATDILPAHPQRWGCEKRTFVQGFFHIPFPLFQKKAASGLLHSPSQVARCIQHLKGQPHNENDRATIDNTKVLVRGFGCGSAPASTLTSVSVLLSRSCE